MTKNQFIKVASLYRPHFKFTLHTGETLDDPETLLYKVEKFKKEIQGMTPNQYNERQFFGWRTSWKYEDNLQEWKEDLEDWSKIEGQLDKTLPEVVHFRVGSSLTRAEAFLREGQGYVTTEDIMGTPDWNPYDRWLGLQVSLLEGPRSDINRSIYYAKQQAYNFRDIPVILEGDIPREFLWMQKNSGEYCISRKHYDKIMNASIIRI